MPSAIAPTACASVSGRNQLVGQLLGNQVDEALVVEHDLDRFFGNWFSFEDSLSGHHDGSECVGGSVSGFVRPLRVAAAPRFFIFVFR